MQTRNRWVFSLILLAAVSFAAWHWMPRERLLLEHAHAVANSEDAARYCWLSDHEMLLIRGGNYAPSRVQHLDLSTGHTERLPRLEAAVNKFNFEEDIFPSPDGKWLLFPPFDGEPNASLVMRNGDRIVAQLTHGVTALAWQPGSARWIHLTYNSVSTPPGYLNVTGITVHDASHPGSIQTLPVTQPVAMQYLDDPIITPANHLVMASSVPDAAQDEPVALAVADCVLGAREITPVRKRTIPLPQGASLGYGEPILSPQGERIAYTCQIERRSPWQSWLHRWLPRVTVPAQHYLAIYVVRLDSARTYEIGHIPIPNSDNMLGGLHWSPDGSRLSFTYRDRLYVVPAD